MVAWGGARAGAGRPKKPLAEQIADGNPGKREITCVRFDNQDEKPQLDKIKKIKIPAFLSQCGKESDDTLPTAAELYQLLTDFIKASGCEKLIAPNLVEDFAHLRRSYLECEFANRKYGRIANGKRSPYVGMAVDYSKQAMAIYDRIWNIISQNSEQPYEAGKNEFLRLLTNRGF